MTRKTVCRSLPDSVDLSVLLFLAGLLVRRQSPVKYVLYVDISQAASPARSFLTISARPAARVNPSRENPATAIMPAEQAA